MEVLPGSNALDLILSSLVLGIVLGLAGYFTALFGAATLQGVGRLARLSVLVPVNDSGFDSASRADEGARGDVNRESNGLMLLAVGFALILVACALEGYVFALLIRLTLL